MMLLPRPGDALDKMRHVVEMISKVYPVINEFQLMVLADIPGLGLIPGAMYLVYNDEIVLALPMDELIYGLDQVLNQYCETMLITNPEPVKHLLH